MNNRRRDTGRRGRSALPRSFRTSHPRAPLSPEELTLKLLDEAFNELMTPDYVQMCDCLIQDDNAVGEV